LHFSNDWPTLRKLEGQLQFDGNSMRVVAKSAQLANLKIQQVTANIDNLSRPNLTVNVTSSMDLLDGVSFLKQSKLSIASDMGLLKGSGPAKATIDLQLPLYQHHAKPNIKGQVSFFQSKLAIPKWSILLRRLTGNLYFQNNAISSHGLQALLFDEPFHIKLQNQNDNQGKKSLAIHADGKVDISKLKNHFLKKPLDTINGATVVHVNMLLHDVTSSLKNTVNIDSNLQGIAITHVPSLLLKNKNEKWPSKVKVVMNRDGHVNFSADIFSQLSSRLLLLHDKAGLHFLSGQISLGDNPAILPKKQGLFITGLLPVVQLSEWEDWFKNTYPDSNVFKNKQALPSFLGGVDLSIGDLIANDQHWRDLFLSIAPLKNGTRIQAQNADISGQIVLPFYKNQVIMGDFDYLFLPSGVSEGKASIKKMDPANLPPLNIHIADLRAKGIRVGDVNLVTNPMHDGLKFKKIQVVSSLMHLNAYGRWIKFKNTEHTDLEGRFDSPDLGALFSQRNISSRLKGGVLSSQFSLSWQGAPSAFALKNTNGSLSMHLTAGRILKLDHETESGLELGRFLNLLSLASVSKYFTFNFSSMTAKGFPFDKLTGDLIIKKGDIITKNIEVDGPLAHVSVSGKIGLTSEKNDLYLLIYPYVSSSLPLIVGLAGGPIAGVATWIVNKIVAPGVGHMMQMRYHVTGSWQHLTVKKV